MTMTMSTLALPVLLVLAGCAGAPSSSSSVTNDSEDALGESPSAISHAAVRGSWEHDGGGGGANSGLVLLGDGKEGAFLRDFEGNHAEGTYAVDLVKKRITFTLTLPKAKTEMYSVEWAPGVPGGRPPTLSIQPQRAINEEGDTAPYDDRIEFARVESWCTQGDSPDVELNECFAAFKDGVWGTTADNQTFTPVVIDACRAATDAKSAKGCMTCNARFNRCVAQ